MQNKTACLLVAILILGCLAACSPASEEEIQSVPTEPAVPTATESLVPTVTTPSPSPTPSMNLEVLESYRWSDVNGTTFIEVLVRNPYEFPVQIYDPHVRLINSAGEIVHRSGDVFFNVASDIGWGRILPGEVVSAQICACLGGGVSEVPEWDSFEFVLDIEEADPDDYTTELEVDLGEFLYTDRNSFHALGTVRNTSDQPLRLAFVRVILRDEAGHYVGFGIAGIIGDFIDGRYTSIEPGDLFEVTVPAYLDSALAGQQLQVEISAIGVIADQ